MVKTGILRDLRCHACGALLLKEEVADGHVQVKCYYCNAMGDYDFEDGARRPVELRPGTRPLRRVAPEPR